MSVAATDRRIERTREALEGAFIRLIFDGRRYDRITIAELIARAGVGRSTFYEHYRSKDELLAATIRYPFAGVAAAVDANARVATLRDALLHFEGNRVHAKAVFTGSARRRIVRVLAAMLEERFRVRARASGVVPATTLGVVAAALAEGMLATIVAWLGGELAGDATRIAAALHAMAQAVAAGFCDR
ncbi:MAG: helix-turn-helix domain-containing protein [Rhodanobacteraceae bacterium]